MFYRITIALFLIFFKMYHRLEMIGARNMPKRGPFIIIANHSCFLDPWYIAAMSLPRCIKFLVTTKWYYMNKFWNLLFYMYDCIPLNPFDLKHSTIKTVVQALKEDRIVGIFPEGKISYDGKLQEFNIGAIYIAMKANVPIIPMAICGSFEALPRHKRFPKPKKIIIIAGEPIRFTQNGNGIPKEMCEIEMQNIRNWIKDQIDQFRKSRSIH